MPQGRILWVHQNFVTSGQAGNSRPVRIVAAMLEKGFAVDVVTAAAGYLGGSNSCDTQPTVEREGDLAVHRLPAGIGYDPSRERKRYYIEFQKAASRYIHSLERPDIIYSSSPPLHQTLLAIRSALRARAPLVLEVRDLWPARLIEGGLVGRFPLPQILRWMESLAYYSADHLIAVAPAYKPYLEAMGVDRKSITILPTGCFRPRGGDRKAGEEWRRSENLGERFVILYAGSFNDSYGLNHVVEAARILNEKSPNVVWVFAGGGTGREMIEDSARKYEFVRYAGCLPKTQLYPVLAGADAGLVPSLPGAQAEINIQGKIFDYLSSSLPIISQLGGQTGIIVEESGAGIAAHPGRKIPGADSSVTGSKKASLQLAGLAATMAALPSEERRLMGEAGRRWGLERFDAERSAREAASIVERVLKERGGEGRYSMILRAAVTATMDLMRGRSVKALASLFPAGSRETVERAFRNWLDTSEAASAIDVPPLTIPTILENDPQNL